jgi:hypothetical protein
MRLRSASLNWSLGFTASRVKLAQLAEPFHSEPSSPSQWPTLAKWGPDLSLSGAKIAGSRLLRLEPRFARASQFS